MPVKSSHAYYGTIPGRQDNGERFRVTYRDGLGSRRDFGFTDDREIAEHYVDQIKRHPLWTRPRVTDRGARA